VFVLPPLAMPTFISNLVLYFLHAPYPRLHYRDLNLFAICVCLYLCSWCTLFCKDIDVRFELEPEADDLLQQMGDDFLEKVIERC